MKWKATAHASDTGWPVVAVICEATARTAGAQAPIAAPIAIFVISLGAGRRLAYQRQNITAPAIKTVLTTASTESIQVIGIVWPKNSSWRFFSDHTRYALKIS